MEDEVEQIASTVWEVEIKECKAGAKDQWPDQFGE